MHGWCASNNVSIMMTSASWVSAFGKCDSVIRPSVRIIGDIIFESSVPASAFSTNSPSGSINWGQNYKVSNFLMCRRYFFVLVYCLDKTKLHGVLLINSWLSMIYS